MLIEKLRCESICLLSSHYAAHSVNTTPEENFHWEPLRFFLPPLPTSLFSLCCDNDTLWEWEDKWSSGSCVIMWQHRIPTPWPRCCLDSFSATARLLFHWSTSITASQRFMQVTVFNLAAMEMCFLWNELRGPVSAEESPWLTFHTIRAFPNAQRSDSLRSSSGTNYAMLLTAFWPPLLHLQSTPLFTVVNNHSYTSTAASHLSLSLTVFLC